MRPRSRFLSRPALAVIILILIATPVLEFVAHRAYRDSVDGQTALVYFFIAIYAVLAILLVWGMDATIRWGVDEFRRSRFASRNTKPS